MKNKKLAILVAALALAACGKPAADTRPRVLVSNPPTAWLVKQIAGDKVVVQTLAHAGGCGHEFQPTDAELAEAAKAQVWFTAGLEFEKAEWAKNLKVKREDMTEERNLGPDHAWMSLQNLEKWAQGIHYAFEKESTFSVEESPTLFSSLDSRHKSLLNLLSPLSGQSFLADHPAYTYFAADYNLHQLAIEEEGHPATDAHLAALIEEAKKAQVKVLFLSEEANRPIAETVAKAVGAKVVPADPNEENTPALLERMAEELVKAHAAKP